MKHCQVELRVFCCFFGVLFGDATHVLLRVNSLEDREFLWMYSIITARLIRAIIYKLFPQNNGIQWHLE